MKRAMVGLFSMMFIVLVGSAAATAAPLTQAPSLTLDDPYGKTVEIRYEASKLTLVNFWATWCLPCHKEMPQLAALVDLYGRQGFRVFGIALESGSASAVQDFIKANHKLGINYPLLMGNPEISAEFGNVEAIPSSFLIDNNGNSFITFLKSSLTEGSSATTFLR